MNAEEKLAHQRQLAAARSERFRAKHPNAGKESGRRRTAAMAKLVERHREEYEKLVAINKEDGQPSGQRHRQARRTLAKRYAEEWRDLLAAAS